MTIAAVFFLFKDFFGKLFAKITNWRYMQPHLVGLYQAINQGKYAGKGFNDNGATRFQQEQYSAEMEEIKDRAIADGTFMQAPNGKPTNLNERQWLQVRTEAFKDWFGDWEKYAPKRIKLGKSCHKVLIQVCSS